MCNLSLAYQATIPPPFPARQSSDPFAFGTEEWHADYAELALIALIKKPITNPNSEISVESA